MNSKIIFRVDGNPKLGLGHIIRCSALAEMLKDSFIICFFCLEIPTEVGNEIKKKGFEIVLIKSEEEFIKQLSSNIIVVLDCYDLDTDYQIQVKNTGAKLVCIDDIHDKRFVADLIINHAPGILPHHYNSTPYTQFALGLDHALLRPVFLKIAKNKRKIDSISNVLICFGGSDPKNLTVSTLSVVLDFYQFKKIIIVTGSLYKMTNKFKGLLESDRRIDHRHSLNENEMLAAMLEAELAIIPASGILMEVISTGCLAISGKYVENQNFFYENFKNENLFCDAKDFGMTNLSLAISKVLSGSFHSLEKIDGASAARFSKLFSNLDLELSCQIRQVTKNDIGLTLMWAVDQRIRQYSFQKHKISEAEHFDWFTKKLNDTYCFYYILETNNIPVGSIRFDVSNDEALISYLIDPEYHGKGLGQIILKKGIEQLVNEKRSGIGNLSIIKGKVIRSNIPSVKAFTRLGFNVMEENDYYIFEKWIN